jgi:hypothetical protein
MCSPFVVDDLNASVQGRFVKLDVCRPEAGGNEQLR